MPSPHRFLRHQIYRAIPGVGAVYETETNMEERKRKILIMTIQSLQQ